MRLSEDSVLGTAQRDVPEPGTSLRDPATDMFYRLGRYIERRENAFGIETLLQTIGSPLYFQTSIAGQARTCGVLTWGLDPNACNARALAAFAHHNINATARGKWANIRAAGGDVFQLGLDGAIARAACGHATAALAIGLGQASFRVEGPAGRVVDVAARANGSCVSQIWLLDKGDIAQVTWHGRPVVRINALNSYAIVGGDLPPGISPEQARQELCGDALTTKLMLITGSTEGAFAQFFNSNGAHGSAPMTGLASLEIARSRIPWLADLLVDGRISYRSGDRIRTDLLPLAEEAAGDRVRITLPSTEVTFRPVLTEEIAA